MRFGQMVFLYKDGVPYVYRLTFRGWLYGAWFSLVDWLDKVFRRNGDK